MAKVISDYLRPLCKNEYSINDTQKFPSMLSSTPPLQDDEENISYDVESLFTNIPKQETINYIIEQIYVHKKLMPICSKLIFRRLLIKLATECTLKFNNRFLKQVDGCAMGGPLSVTFSDIYLVKMENDFAIPSKPNFYCRFVDDIYSRRKLRDNVLFDRLKSYHPNIKLINSTFTGKTQNYLHHGLPKLQNAINEIQCMVIFIIAKEYHETLIKKSL